MAIYPSIGRFERLRNLKEKITTFLRSLSKKEIAGLTTLLFMLIILPLSVFAVRYQAYRASQAQFPLTPPITPPIQSPSPTPSPPPSFPPPSPSASASPSATPFPSPFPSPSPSPLGNCNSSCSSNQDCLSGLVCGTPCPPGQVCPQYLWCYNPDCPYEKDCICPPPSPTPAVSPTPTPTPNNNPWVSTRYLKQGKQGLLYSSWVTAVDKDINDQLGMSAKNLPPGLKLERCRRSRPWSDIFRRWAWVRCRIRGRPTATGIYYVEITVRDDKGGRTTKILPLRIRPRRRGWSSFFDYFNF